jgi:hypothetical protein
LEFSHHLTVEQETKAIPHQQKNFSFFFFSLDDRFTHQSLGNNKFESPNNKAIRQKRKFEYRSWGLKTPKLQATDMSRLCE